MDKAEKPKKEDKGTSKFIDKYYSEEYISKYFN